jgi:hypothetical protein
MLCEEGVITIEAKSALLLPHNIKQIVPAKTLSNTRKIDKHCKIVG